MAEPVYDRDLHPSLEPWMPSDGDAFDRVKAGHVLNRAGFGGTPSEIELLQDLGVADGIDLLLDFPDASAAEMSPNDVPDDSMLVDVPQTNQERRVAMSALRNVNGEEANTRRQLLRQTWTRASLRHIAACQAWWIRRMTDGPYPLQEKLTLFWAGLFTSSIRSDRGGSWRLWNQNETLRRHAAGNFIELVRRISRDAAMLQYLNNDRNVKRSPNENYARELMELFTLGVGNYSEDDIKNVARAFTGWSHNGRDFQFNPDQHDDGVKTVFGQQGNFGGDDVVALIARHPACAPYISGRLYHYFVGSAPAPEVAASLARVLVNSNFELRPLLRTILRSKAFFSSDNIGNKIKSPVQLLAGTYRLFDLDVPGARPISRQLEKLGQVPFAPPNVKGWPGQFDGRLWINTATLLARYNFTIEAAGQARPQPQSDSPADIVDTWLNRLIPRFVDSLKRRRLIATVGSPPTAGGTLDAVKLIVSMPEYQLC
jgi:uncharacterized protein (DUF1800 family)